MSLFDYTYKHYISLGFIVNPAPNDLIMIIQYN